MIRRPFTYVVAVLYTALLAAGCAKNDQSTSSASLSHGAEVFAANCAACHGTAGAGGLGPSLRGENQRKNLEATVAWIKQPAPPMPKLYPAPLSEHDVDDVATYVQSL
jgi:mono/diheme cytochrome c family protein